MNKLAAVGTGQEYHGLKDNQVRMVTALVMRTEDCVSVVDVDAALHSQWGDLRFGVMTWIH